MPAHLKLAVALDGAGWHPAAWREPTASPNGLFTADYWSGLVQLAERGLLDFVTFEDSFGLPGPTFGERDHRADHVRGKLDAVLIAARVAPLTSHIGLVPTTLVTHTEPFHVSKAIATLDYVSTGRGGLRAQISGRADDSRLFGRRDIPEFGIDELAKPEVAQLISDLFDEATDYVEVVRRLWDSWEDDAEIRDAATGRFIDRDKIHYIDFTGKYFSVKGPSIVPRPPQGQPLVTALAHSTIPYRFAARSVDVVYVTPTGQQSASGIVGEVHAEQRQAGRSADVVHIFADLVVFLDSATETGAARKARLDERDNAEYASDAHIFTGNAAQLADLLADWHLAGITGYRLRPGALPDDLASITTALVPELQRRNLFCDHYEASTLRGLLGLTRPVNRYASTLEGATA